MAENNINVTYIKFIPGKQELLEVQLAKDCSVFNYIDSLNTIDDLISIVSEKDKGFVRDALDNTLDLDYRNFEFEFLDVNGDTFIILGVLYACPGNQHSFLFLINTEQFVGYHERYNELITIEKAQANIIKTLGETGHTLSGTLNFDEVLDLLLQEIRKVVPYDSANLMVLENDRLVITRFVGYENYPNHPINQATAKMSFPIKETKNLYYIYENLAPLVISNVEESEQWTAVSGTEMINSWVGVPIIAQGKLIGLFSLDKKEKNFYTNSHVEILSRFAGQASLAMQNARRFEHLNEILSREQKLNELLHKISKTLDIQVIMRGLAEIASEIWLCNAISIVLQNKDDTLNMLRYFPKTKKVSFNQVDESFSIFSKYSSIMQNNTPLYIGDYKEREESKSSKITTEFNTFLGLPISIGSSAIGVISLFHHEKNKDYNAHDYRLLETLTKQTFIAIQNARLYEAERISRKNAEALREAVNAITSALELDQVLERVLVFLEHVVPYDSATIFLIEADTIMAVAGRGLPNPELVINRKFPRNNELFFEAERTKKPVYIPNAQIDPRFQQWGAALYIAGWMGIPIIWHGQVIGMLTIDSITPNAYGAKQATLAQAYADQAAIAIKNSQMFEKTKVMSITDPLTNLFNRRHFFEIAQAEFEKFRMSALPFSIIIFDLDNFKQINDSYGHLTGDQVLIAVAQAIQSQLREEDLLCRFGGDEYIALLKAIDKETVKKIVLRMDQAIQNIQLPNIKCSISASIGYASPSPETNKLDEIVNMADKMLYEIKAIHKANFNRSSN